MLEERGRIHARVPGEHPDDVAKPGVERLDDRVDLDPVAGADQHRFGHGGALQQLAEDLAGVPGRDRHPLPHAHVGRANRQPHN